MRYQGVLRIAAAIAIVALGVIGEAAAIKATVDVDERVALPVPHRYIHGVIPDDARFQLALPENWNGKLAVFSRGFSGTELTTGAFKTTALEKGYAFAASDEGWNRLTIAKEPEDTYYESRQRIRELTLYAHQVVTAHYKKAASRTLMMGGSNGGHHTKWMVESYPDLYGGGIAGYGFNSQVSQWGSNRVSRRVRRLSRAGGAAARAEEGRRGARWLLHSWHEPRRTGIRQLDRRPTGRAGAVDRPSREQG